MSSHITPGVCRRGALDARAKTITNKMKIAAAFTLEEAVKNLSIENIPP